MWVCVRGVGVGGGGWADERVCGGLLSLQWIKIFHKKKILWPKLIFFPYIPYIQN